jgi:hypothetical protein
MNILLGPLGVNPPVQFALPFDLGVYAKASGMGAIAIITKQAEINYFFYKTLNIISTKIRCQ